jgi:DNA-binding protein Fis
LDSREKSRLESLIEEAVHDAINRPSLYNQQGLYQVVLETVEIMLIERALAYTKGNKTQAARVLGISRNTLARRISQYGLDGKGR